MIKIDKILSNPDEVINQPNGTSEKKAESKSETGVGVDEFFSPDEILAVMQDSLSNKPIVMPNIEFDYNRATLREDSKLELNKLYTFMKNSANVQVEIIGHTDNNGDEDFNMRLSQKRAEEIKAYLVSKGIQGTRILTMGYGEYKPIAPNTLPDGSDNPKGRKKNNRIEMKFLFGKE